MDQSTTTKLWLDQQIVPTYLKDEILQQQNNSDWLAESFGVTLDFGTAGMRGLMGPGSSKMNIFTVAQVTEGLAQLMDELGEAVKKQGVVICYDSRYHSREFAEMATMVLGAHDIKVYLFDDIRSTPELSFAIRELETYAGIMITASHNPKNYNGYKIYGPDGGQMPPKEVQSVVDYRQKVQDIFAIPTKSIPAMRDEKLLQIIGEDIDEKYLTALKTLNVDHDLIAKFGHNLKIIYTPLHGAGNVLFRRLFHENGFDNVEVVTEQAIIDPEFSSVPFPNPEFAEAFVLGIKQAKKSGASLIIATDPDADRMGIAVLDEDGTYQLLTGNQIATLYTNYILAAKKTTGQLRPDLEIVKSIVSSELPFVIAADYGIKTKNVLTGFKYIGEEIEYLNTSHTGEFIFGFEESYGYLFKDFVRDKDSLQAMLMIAEVAAYYESKNQSMIKGLDEIYQKYGYFIEETRAIEVPGVDGAAKMQQMMADLRADNLTEIAGEKVSVGQDYLNQTQMIDGKQAVFTDFPVADVLKYYLADGSWIALRPSGTEPKIKIYVGATGKTNQETLDKVEKYQNFFAKILQ